MLEKIDFFVSKSTTEPLTCKQSVKTHFNSSEKMSTLTTSTNKPNFTFDDDDLFADNGKTKAVSQQPPATQTSQATQISPVPQTSNPLATILSGISQRAATSISASKTTKDFLHDAQTTDELIKAIQDHDTKQDADIIVKLTFEKFFDAVKGQIGLGNKDFKKLKSMAPLVQLMEKAEHFQAVKKACLEAYNQHKQSAMLQNLGFEFDDDDKDTKDTKNDKATTSKELVVRHSLEDDALLAEKLQAEEIEAAKGSMVVRRTHDNQMIIPPGTSNRALQAATQFDAERPFQTPTVINGPVAFGGTAIMVNGATNEQIQQAVQQAAAQAMSQSSRQGNAGLSRLGGKPGPWAI